MEESTKDLALEFLNEFGKTLNKTLPGPADMEAWVRPTVAAAKINGQQKHLRLPEAAFLNGQALPVLFNFLQSYSGLSKEQARKALLNEYYRTTPAISMRSPIRWEKHPFRKILGANARDIYRKWKNPDERGALTQSSPDFSLREPFPHSILFEGKYFPHGTLEYAQTTLVTDIYQAFFYRGLPSLEATKKHSEWKYDYACLLAYDASPKGTLSAAWTALDSRTKRSFWVGANVYVMILGGKDG
jgi:hypothetical protein